MRRRCAWARRIWWRALIESGWQTPVLLRDPVKAIKQISRDQSLKWLVETDGGELSAD